MGVAANRPCGRAVRVERLHALYLSALMTHQAIIAQTVEAIKCLPVEKAEEIAEFAAFLQKRYEEQQLTRGLQRLTAASAAFAFLADEEDLYSAADLVEKYDA